MRNTVLTSVACLTVYYFRILSQKRHDFRKHVTKHKMCVLIFCTNLSETFLILRITERDMIKKISIGPHVKYPLFLSHFNDTRIFSADFRKDTQISNFVKIHPVGVELFLAGGRTDRQTDRQTSGQACMRKPSVAFRSFANAPSNTFVLRNRSRHKFRYIGLNQK
jgi:hypothetical protein